MAKFEKAVEDKYLTYRRIFEAQQLLVKGPKDHLFNSIEGLTNLQDVTLQTDGCPHMMTKRFLTKYMTDCAVPQIKRSPHTVWQLERVLRSSPDLKSLSMRHLSTLFFVEEDTHDGMFSRSLSWLQTVFRPLESLRLSLAQDDKSDVADEDAVVPIGSRMLKHTKLHQVLKSAVNLQYLTINFLGAERAACALPDLMPQVAFDQLSSLDLDFFEAEEEALLTLLSTQPKLASLNLGFVILSRGSWASLVRRMRNNLKLRFCMLGGVLEDGSNTYCMDLCERDMWGEDGMQFTMSMALDSHITDKDDNFAEMGFDNEDDFDTCCNPILRYDDDFADEDDLTYEFGPIDSDDEELKDDSDNLDHPSGDSEDESLPELEPTSPMSLDSVK